MVALFDWEDVQLGDPVQDVGWMLMRRSRRKTNSVQGILSREAFLTRYRELTGIAVSDDSLCFWEAMTYVKLAGIFLSGARAFADRQRSDPRLAITPLELPLLRDELAGIVL